MYGRTQFLNQNNFRSGDFALNSNRNNFRAAGNFAQRNGNVNYNHGHGLAGQNYRNNNFSPNNTAARFEGHHNAPTSQPGINRAHDNNRRDMRDRSYNPRPRGNGFVQNGVYHRRDNVGPPNTATYESGRSLGGSGQEGMRKVRVVANVPSEIQGRSNENSNVSDNCETEISNFTNNVNTTNNQGN